VAIQPGGEVWEDRRRLSAAADRAIAFLWAGATADALEVEGVDFKEEAGRRARGGVVLPGQPRSEAVAGQLADEVACLANTPGGGVLVVGVADDGTLIGAASERDWLRHRIHERVDIAPAIDERELPDGTRLLILLVAESREPVENTSDQLRWRVGPSCRPVDRSEWWAERLRRQGSDPLAAETSRTLVDVAPGALSAAARLTSNRHDRISGREQLTRLGVLLPNGRLTAAGVHMFCAAPRTVLELAVVDVAGGDVVSSPADFSGLSLVEQLGEVEARLDVLDSAVVLKSGWQLQPIRQVPWAALREAVLNAIVHRDWLPGEPIHITWVIADGSLDVVSPGGFVGGVTSDSVLSARYSRNPALADLARAMGLVERQGIGVDRMYREMVSLGHRPPIIREEAGPQVRTRLVGGQPLPAVIEVISAVSPMIRQRDVRVAVGLYALLREGFLTAASLGPLLQVPSDEAEEAIDVMSDCLVDDEPMIRPATSGPWLPAEGIVRHATEDQAALAQAKRRGLLTWYRPSHVVAEQIVRSFLRASGRISSGDLAEVTRISPQGARNLLTRMEQEGSIRRGTASRGRSAHFVAAG
jgi:ATP-dependent DNA helicase RecG